MDQITTLWSYFPEVTLPKKKSPAPYFDQSVVQHQHCADMSPIVRIAGLSGAVAVALGAYGAHGEFLGELFTLMILNTHQ